MWQINCQASHFVLLRGCSKPQLAVAGLVDPPSPRPPPPWLAAAGQKRLGGGSMAKIKENEEKTATLGVPGSQVLVVNTASMTHGLIFSSGTAGTLVALVRLLGTSVFAGVLSESFWRTQFKMNENFFAFLALTFALPVALPLPPFFQQCPIPHQCIQHLNRPYPRALPHTPCAGGWGGGGLQSGSVQSNSENTAQL